MNIKLRKTISAAALVFLLYLAAAIFQSEFFGDLLAPLADLLSAGIIFYSVINSTGSKYHLCSLFGFAVLFWAAADILWAFYSLVLHTDPGNSIVIIFLYSGTSVLLFLATVIYSVFKFRKWDFVQLLLDAVSMSVSVLWLLWVLIFDKSYDELGLLAKHDVVNSFNIMIDTVMLIVIMIWYFSIRGGKIPLYLRIISGSVYFYTVVDLCYYYFYMKGLYIPNSLLDVCYMATLLVLAIGVNMYFSTSPLPDLQDSPYSNIGYRKKGWLLLAAPVLILVFKEFDIFDLSILILIFFLHEGISIYIQAAIANKKLLERELNLNGELEHRIAERTKDLKQKNDELEYITQHDGLTGLYNRRYFLQKTESKIAELPQDETLTLLVWDINRLKTINSTYGHSVGDQILISLAGRIQSICGKEDILARLSGDEFVIELNGKYFHEEIESIAKQIVSLCNEPIKIGQYTFHVTVCVGISTYPIDAYDRDTLLKNADISMHYAKKQGLLKCISFFDTVNETIQRRHLWSLI